MHKVVSNNPSSLVKTKPLADDPCITNLLVADSRISQNVLTYKNILPVFDPLLLSVIPHQLITIKVFVELTTTIKLIKNTDKLTNCSVRSSQAVQIILVTDPVTCLMGRGCTYRQQPSLLTPKQHHDLPEALDLHFPVTKTHYRVNNCKNTVKHT